MEDPKQLILADQNLRDLCPVMDAGIDIAIGEENNYEIKVRRDKWRPEYTFGNVFYIKETEYGGIIGEVNTNTAEDTISLLGMTWRGMLDKKVICPPAGQGYRKVSGELNQVLNDLVMEHFDDPSFDGLDLHGFIKEIDRVTLEKCARLCELGLDGLTEKNMTRVEIKTGKYGETRQFLLPAQIVQDLQGLLKKSWILLDSK